MRECALHSKIWAVPAGKKEKLLLTLRQIGGMAGAALAFAWLTVACGVKDVTVLPPEQVLPLLEASLEELLARVQEQSEAIRSVNARAELLASTGSAYSGVIEQYRDVRAYVLAQRGESGPANSAAATHIRLLGQAPVVRKNVFDMVADETEFRIYIPPKNKFIVGQTRMERVSEKPIENLRPQHLLEAFLLLPPGRALHALEENEVGGTRYYVVSEIAVEGERASVLRKWWFRRTNLALARMQRFGPRGELASDVHYDVWTQHGHLRYPHWILFVRPQEDYRLEFRFDRVELNPGLDPDRFRLEQPEGTELVDLTRPADEKPAAGKPPAEPRP